MPHLVLERVVEHDAAALGLLARLVRHAQLDAARDDHAEVAGELRVGRAAVGGDVRAGRQARHEDGSGPARDRVDQPHQRREHAAVFVPAVAAVVEVQHVPVAGVGALVQDGSDVVAERHPLLREERLELRADRRVAPFERRHPREAGGVVPRASVEIGQKEARPLGRIGGREQRRLAGLIAPEDLGQVLEQLQQPVHRRAMVQRQARGKPLFPAP